MHNFKEMAQALRFLSIDAVEKAQSGHPGMPMGMADVATVLWRQFLRHNPQDPHWSNRDRFVLSNGHGSMLLYALLHLTGYDVTIDDIKQFRQLGSNTPGHPEYGVTPGVEATTGPLGQGLANGVGIAIAEQVMAKTFNKPGCSVIDHYTYVFAGDGCLMEGISHEASSLAGTLSLGKLIVFWDDNGISIDGRVDSWFAEDVAARYRAYGFHVIEAVDGHDPDAIAEAITAARSETGKPSLICCKTQIGYGSSALANTAKVHGAPLGTTEVAAVRKALRWPYPPFSVPEALRSAWSMQAQGHAAQQTWQTAFNEYAKQYPELAEQYHKRHQLIPDCLTDLRFKEWLLDLQETAKPLATRKASQQFLAFIQPKLSALFGGSADLSCSNLTQVDASIAVKDQWEQANYLHYGVREFAMFAIANGLASYGGFIPFCGTFLTFIDYGRNALRIAAMNKQRVIYVLTHDSIGLGEDGPTHQPIEHASMLRATPNVDVWRPCDSVETAVAWQQSLVRTEGPSCLLLSRQTLPVQARTTDQIGMIERGAYTIFSEESDSRMVILMATGSEVQYALGVAHALVRLGYGVHVVSIPSMEAFSRQETTYKHAILPPSIHCRVAIEAAASDSWYRLTGLHGLVCGIDHYGESAPGEVVMQAYGFTVAQLTQRIKGYCAQFYTQQMDTLEEK